jgi:hypothetical protein
MVGTPEQVRDLSVDIRRCELMWDRAFRHHHGGPTVETSAKPDTPMFKAALDLLADAVEAGVFQPAAKPALLTHTQIFTLAPRAIAQNVQIRTPATGGISVPTNLGFRSIEPAINLTTADKEAIGKVLGFAVYFAANDQFIAGYPMDGFPGFPVGTGHPWTSYGKQYTSTAPDGTVTVNPDPSFHINIDTIAGQQIYAIYQAVGIATAGVTVDGLK